MTTKLVRYDAMCRAIDAAYKIDEVKEIRAQAVALELYMRQARNKEAVRRCNEIRLRAERKAAQLYDAQEKAKGTRATFNGRSASGGPLKRPPEDDARTLADFGVSKQQMAEWRKLAAVPEDRFETALADIEIPTLDGVLRVTSDPASLRPTPARQGPDFWSTPPSLIAALVEHVLPTLPHRKLWECAAGDGRLVTALTAAGAKVLATDREPQMSGIGSHDFLAGKLSSGATGTIVVTNPPGNQLDGFINQGLKLLDSKITTGLILLLRHDHLQGSERVDVLNRATWEVNCNWRPIWIADTEGNPRWSYRWIVWTGQRRRPPLYLREGVSARGFPAPRSPLQVLLGPLVARPPPHSQPSSSASTARGRTRAPGNDGAARHRRQT